MCDALAYLSEHSLQAFRVEIISRRLGPGLGGTPWSSDAVNVAGIPTQVVRSKSARQMGARCVSFTPLVHHAARLIQINASLAGTVIEGNVR